MVLSAPAYDDKLAEAAFEERYITTAQICSYLGVSRTAVHYKQKAGELPGCIQHQKVRFWERSVVMPHLEAWKKALETRGVGAN